MLFRDVIGQRDIIRRLLRSVDENRVSHAQMFLGPEGTGNMALALAYVQYLNCENPQQIDREKHGFDRDSCGECPSCKKIQNLSHPDLHFIFPLPADLRKLKKDKAANEKIYAPWRELIHETEAYLTLDDLHGKYNLKGKQTLISAEDCNEIIQKVSLHSYEGGYKAVIIWMPEKLFYSAAPKILKTLEEPPDKTLFILVAEHQEQIINTILSRTQILQVPRLEDAEIKNALVERGHASEEQAIDAAMLASGNYALALKNVADADWMQDNLNQFKTLTRLSFELHKKHELKKTQSLLKWVGDMAQSGREYQKNFLNYALRLFREAILTSYDSSGISRMSPAEQEFMNRFYRVINHANILNITAEFEKAVYAVERNGNGNLIFLDLCFFLNKELRRGHMAISGKKQ
jgi:DNA polymerase-3 subunit delta'